MSVFLKVACTVILIVAGIPLGFAKISTSAQPITPRPTTLANALSEQHLAQITLYNPTASGAVPFKKTSSKSLRQVIGAFEPPPVDPPKTTGGSGTR